MKNKKKIIAIIAAVGLALVLIGVTYAYWLVTKTQTNPNVISSACLDITLDNESAGISLENQYPLSDEDGMKLTPYTFTVTNKCNTSVDYQIALESIGDETTAVSSSALKVALDNIADILSNGATIETTISGAYAANLLGYGTLAAIGNEGSSATHSLRIWIDENAPISEANKTFQSKISVTIGQGIEGPAFQVGTMAYDILANNTLTVSEVDFSTPATDTNENIYKAQDDLGASYYFRGSATNNYVQFGKYADDYKLYTISDAGNCWEGSCTYFTLESCQSSADVDYDSGESCVELASSDAGKDMYWRIVRINGDGTIRLIYDGTAKVTNGTPHSVILYETVYSEAGDMQINYGDSRIKVGVDTWYSTHLKTNYETSIADGIFCNDKEVSSYTYYDEEYNETTQENAIYTDTNYAPHDRLVNKKTPSLTCTREEDRYTKTTELGNGQLTHPVGLLTADEAFFAGGTTVSNKAYYLYTGDNFWTSSPDCTSDDGGIATLFTVRNNGDVGGDPEGYSYGVRPVINLRADVEFTGNGSFDTPYVIKTN